MNSEQLEILKRAADRLRALSKIAMKRNEIKMAKELDEEYTMVSLAVLALEK